MVSRGLSEASEASEAIPPGHRRKAHPGGCARNPRTRRGFVWFWHTLRGAEKTNCLPGVSLRSASLNPRLPSVTPAGVRRKTVTGGSWRRRSPQIDQAERTSRVRTVAAFRLFAPIFSKMC
jgi:hypothetical protein